MKDVRVVLVVLGAMAVFVTTDVARSGSLEPPGPPAPTMHTLEDIYTVVVNTNSKVNALKCDAALVAETGQITPYATGDDGSLQMGVTWPTPRFADNGDGTVTDNLTGLIWLRNAVCFGQKTWSQALSDCNELASGPCGLTDGSSAGEWRLPNVKELQSLIDYGLSNPALPSGHPFTGLQLNPVDAYWCSTTCAYNSNDAWAVNFHYGSVNSVGIKSNYGFVWPVKAGQ